MTGPDDQGAGGASLLPRLQGRADPSAPAFSPDGERWYTAADLLRLSERVAGPVPVQDGDRGVAVLPLAGRDPLAVVTGLLAAERTGAVPLVVPAGRGEAGAALAVRGVEGWGDRRGSDPGAAAGPLLAVTTSGTSGAPRTVVRTVASWRAALEPFTALAGAGPGALAWAPGDLSSTLTLWAVWHALATGVPVVTGPWRSGGRLRPAVRAATVVHCVPPVLRDVLDERARGSLPRCGRAVVAGAPLGGSLRRRAGDAGLDVVEYYGAAELSFVAADPDGRGLRPFPGVEVRVRAGRIEVRSPYVCLGYADPGRRAGPFRRDRDGWAGVGDLGALSADGVLSVAGRGEDAVLVGGHVVHVADVEDVLAAVPEVAEAVCVGEPHPRWGARVVAVVRAVPGADPLPALRRAARAGLAPAARPSRYVLVDELPRTPGGKVARATLRERIGR